MSCLRLATCWFTRSRVAPCDRAARLASSLSRTVSAVVTARIPHLSCSARMSGSMSTSYAATTRSYRASSALGAPPEVVRWIWLEEPVRSLRSSESAANAASISSRRAVRSTPSSA